MTESSPPLYRFHAGTAPLLVSMPHCGTHLPQEIAQRLSDTARALPDTDWHIERLYEFAAGLGASVITATHSRYVVDLNRPPDNANLYPGQSTTSLCPLDNFDGSPAYRRGQEPDPDEVATRCHVYWQPYHARLNAELRRLRELHGAVVLWDAHSIRSRVPRFFEGTLPDFNVGTADGSSCDERLSEAVMRVAREATGHTSVLNGRFKGGFITRHYGAPHNDIHAVQMELSQRLYMDEEAPFTYRPERAEALQGVLAQMVEAALAFARGR